jgi:hypothetical protein
VAGEFVYFDTGCSFIAVRTDERYCSRIVWRMWEAIVSPDSAVRAKIIFFSSAVTGTKRRWLRFMNAKYAHDGRVSNSKIRLRTDRFSVGHRFAALRSERIFPSRRTRAIRDRSTGGAVIHRGSETPPCKKPEQLCPPQRRSAVELG